MLNKTQKLERKYCNGLDCYNTILHLAKQVLHLTHSETILYIELLNRMDNNTVDISVSELTDAIGIYTKDTVIKNIKGLEDKQIIKVDRRNVSNIITINGIKKVEIDKKGV